MTNRFAKSFVPAASAASNSFSVQQLRGGYDLASDGKDAEGSCGDKKAEDSGGDGKKLKASVAKVSVAQASSNA